jgi:FkbM family methyltransferase
MRSFLFQKLNSVASRLRPFLPGSMQLRLLTQMLRWTSSNEREAFYLEKIGPNRGVSIDIGANYGLYSVPMSKLYDQVIAFEPNPSVTEPLVKARIPNLTLINECLSSEPGETILRIPVSGKVLLSGWATIEAQPTAVGESTVELPVKRSTLDGHHFANVGLIKIDVEGHELEVLKGGEKTIRRDRPVLLVEIQENRLDSVRNLLNEWGYHETTLHKLAGIEGSPQNYIFQPNSPLRVPA